MGDPAYERSIAAIEQDTRIMQLERERDELRVQLATARERIAHLEVSRRQLARRAFGPDGEDMSDF